MLQKRFGEYLISSDKEKLDIKIIHNYLSEESYWAKNIPISIVKECIDNSFCLGIYVDEIHQIGFARLITDYTTFAYLADVFILKSFQGKGLGTAMIDSMMELEWVKYLRRLMLMTQDAHGLYQRYGFSNLSHPNQAMEKVKKNPYS